MLFALTAALAVLIDFRFASGDYLDVADVLNGAPEPTRVARPDKVGLRQAVLQGRRFPFDLLRVSIFALFSVGLAQIRLVHLVYWVLFLQLHAVPAFLIEIVFIFSSILGISVSMAFIVFLAGHLVLSGHFLDWVLVAVVLDAFFFVLGAFLVSGMLLFISVKLLLVVFILFFAFFLSFLLLAHHHHDAAVFVLVHQLILLDHALQVLKDHLAGEEPSDQGLHFDERSEESLLLLVLLLVLLHIVVVDVVLLLVGVLHVVILFASLVVPICVLMLFFVRSDHHIFLLAFEVAVVRPTDALRVLIIVVLPAG